MQIPKNLFESSFFFRFKYFLFRFRVLGMFHCIIFLVKLVLDSISSNAEMIPKEDPLELVYNSKTSSKKNYEFQFKNDEIDNFSVFLVYL